MAVKKINTKEKKVVKSKEVWINPVGGLGDMILFSTVLKLAYEKNPKQKFNIIRRSGYYNILKGHPAINQIGHPPKDAFIMGTDYWSKEELGGGNQRAIQILARTFGLKTPIEENLYVPEENENDEVLYKQIPWKKKNVIIAPFSDSPRKALHPIAWHQVTEFINSKGALTLQPGRVFEMHIKNSYSLLGLTTPKQLIALMKKVDLVVTSDNFIMHAARLAQKPAVVVWGPTKSEVYGYKEHTHIQAPMEHCHMVNDCIGPRHPQNYATPCPLAQEHCMNKINLELIFKAIDKLL